MSLAGRVQGDLVRYWNVHGVPVKEDLVVTYAPNDWRGAPLPQEIHDRYVPELIRLAREEAAAPIDGDGNNYSVLPEKIVNSWLVESRAYTHTNAPVDGEALLEPIKETDNPQFFRFFERLPREGVSRISEQVYLAMVGRIRSRYETEITAFMEAQVAEHMNRRARMSEDVANILLGPVPSAESLIEHAMKTYDAHPEVH